MPSPQKAKYFAVEIIKNRIPLDDLLSEIAAEMINPVADSVLDGEEPTEKLELFKEQVIKIFDELLNRKLERETVENLTEKEVTYLRDSLVELKKEILFEMKPNYDKGISEVKSKVTDMEHNVSSLQKEFIQVNELYRSFIQRVDALTPQVDFLNQRLPLVADKDSIVDLKKQLGGDDGSGGLRGAVSQIDKTSSLLNQSVSELGKTIEGDDKQSGLKGMTAKVQTSNSLLKQSIENLGIIIEGADKKSGLKGEILDLKRGLKGEISNLSQKISALESKLTGLSYYFPSILSTLAVMLTVWGGYSSLSGVITENVEAKLELKLREEFETLETDLIEQIEMTIRETQQQEPNTGSTIKETQQQDPDT